MQSAVTLVLPFQASADGQACSAFVWTSSGCLGMQVNSFLPCHLADMVSAYAHMVHHPGPLLDQMTQRMLPKLDTMDAGRPSACMLQQRAALTGCFDILVLLILAVFFLGSWHNCFCYCIVDCKNAGLADSAIDTCLDIFA